MRPRRLPQQLKKETALSNSDRLFDVNSPVSLLTDIHDSLYMGGQNIILLTSIPLVVSTARIRGILCSGVFETGTPI